MADHTIARRRAASTARRVAVQRRVRCRTVAWGSGVLVRLRLRRGSTGCGARRPKPGAGLDFARDVRYYFGIQDQARARRPGAMSVHETLRGGISQSTSPYRIVKVHKARNWKSGPVRADTTRTRGADRRKLFIGSMLHHDAHGGRGEGRTRTRYAGDPFPDGAGQSRRRRVTEGGMVGRVPGDHTK